MTLEKAMVFLRNQRVGIGNALGKNDLWLSVGFKLKLLHPSFVAIGGFGEVMESALVDDRALVVTSIIIQKFCDLVVCSLRLVPHSPGTEPT